MNRILYATIGGMFTILMLLITSWVNSVNAHADVVDIRVTTLEMHYAAIDQHLVDIEKGVTYMNVHEAIKEVKERKHASAR